MLQRRRWENVSRKRAHAGLVFLRLGLGRLGWEGCAPLRDLSWTGTWDQRPTAGQLEQLEVCRSWRRLDGNARLIGEKGGWA